MSDEQRERLLIAEQIERAAAESNETENKQEESAVEEGLKRTDENEKVVLSLSLKSSTGATTTAATDIPASSSSSLSHAPSAPITTSVAPLKMNPLKMTANPLKRTNVFKAASTSSTASAPSVSADSKLQKRPMSAVESIIIEEQERKRRKMEKESGGGSGI